MDHVSSADVAARGEYERPWKRIASDMRAKIADGRLRPGERLATIAEMQEEYGVAKNTVRNALGQLQEEGLVESRGRSLYVSTGERPHS